MKSATILFLIALIALLKVTTPLKLSPVNNVIDPDDICEDGEPVKKNEQKPTNNTLPVDPDDICEEDEKKNIIPIVPPKPVEPVVVPPKPIDPPKPPKPVEPVVVPPKPIDPPKPPKPVEPVVVPPKPVVPTNKTKSGDDDDTCEDDGKKHNKTKNSNSTDPDEECEGEEKKVKPIPPKRETNKTEVVQNTTITNKTEEKPKVFVSEICKMQDELIKAFLDLSYKSTELINKFKVHIQLYGKWIKEVEGRLSSKEQIEEAKNALKAQEKKYLDSYLIDAITIYEILIKLKAEIEKYKRAECDQPFIPTNITTSNTTTTTITTTTVISSNVTNSPTTITTQKPVEPKKDKTLDTSEITKATNTLIQLITERYDSLGITMDRKLAIMLKTTMGAKSRKFLRCH
jgi:PIN domain nuclease of toxin-antitoxin system